MHSVLTISRTKLLNHLVPSIASGSTAADNRARLASEADEEVCGPARTAHPWWGIACIPTMTSISSCSCGMTCKSSCSRGTTCESSCSRGTTCKGPVATHTLLTSGEHGRISARQPRKRCIHARSCIPPQACVNHLGLSSPCGTQVQYRHVRKQLDNTGTKDKLEGTRREEPTYEVARFL